VSSNLKVISILGLPRDWSPCTFAVTGNELNGLKFVRSFSCKSMNSVCDYLFLLQILKKSKKFLKKYFCFNRKVQNMFGGRLKFSLSGAAPISSDVLNFMRCALGIPITEGISLQLLLEQHYKNEKNQFIHNNTQSTTIFFSLMPSSA